MGYIHSRPIIQSHGSNSFEASRHGQNDLLDLNMSSRTGKKAHSTNFQHSMVQSHLNHH